MKNNHGNSRREFIRNLSLAGLGAGAMQSLPISAMAAHIQAQQNAAPFIPRRLGSWWCTVEDLLWSQKKIKDKIKRRAAGFAEANIDTAVNFGFHVRFDFANYFGQLHGYYANVREELHKYNIKFIEHYSCNHVERPRGEAEFKKLHRTHRHHVLLFHDPIAAKHAQYEGHLFQEICQVDLRDGSRGYALQYQLEAFCHNNPGFLDMHYKYLQRLEKEVNFDGYQVDDMCNYAGLTTCGCKHCRDRFKKDYGHEIPPFSDKNFFGDTNKPMLQWGNYENPVFRDWLKMKDDSITDHVKMVKSVIGNKPLMTCCSSTGPVTLNAISLNLENMAKHVDFFMLENVGINVKCVKWVEMDAEAMQQKDIAMKRGAAPAIACSYTIYKEGAYLGWGLARFWGVADWASTLQGRLEEDPADGMEMEDVIREVNNWEVKNSPLDFTEGNDLVEVRLVSNKYCRANGWKGTDKKEHWDKVKEWSAKFVINNIGYRFLRAEELADAKALLAGKTPLVLDSVACVSDAQYKSLQQYLAAGGKALLVLPFGTHDENGHKRKEPLKLTGKHLQHIKTGETDLLSPAIKQTGGDKGWAVRGRNHKGKIVLHFMSTAMVPVPHPVIKDMGGNAILQNINSGIKDNALTFEVDTRKVPLSALQVLSPELENSTRSVEITRKNKHTAILKVNLEGIKVYAVAQ